MVFRSRRTKHARKKGDAKFNNTKVEMDGHVFDSKAESERYVELKLMQRAGEISDLKLQPLFVLIDSFKLRKRTIRKLTYSPDFLYVKDGIKYAEDVKGATTEKYRIKRKLFLYFYGEEYVFIESKKRKYSFSERVY